MRLRWATAMSIAALLAVGSSGAAGDRGPYFPNDVTDGTGWAAVQWNFSGDYGVGAPVAWGNLIASGSPGGSGVIVAVLDTGVGDASRSTRAATDLASAHLVRGWDFVDDDPDPADENGHGTAIASMIAADTNNGFGLTGLAYGARIMPVRVIDRFGLGDRNAIARGIRFAVDHGAKVINLSFAFGRGVDEADLAAVLGSLEYAAERGVLVVGAAGNDGGASINYPARSKHVLAVGATTEFGCAAAYSNHGPELDLVAPGGGTDAALEDEHCRGGRRGRDVPQLTSAGVLGGSFGSSFAVPHVSATAALVLATGILGPNPTPARIEARLERTARDLGAPGHDVRYGWGLVSAAAATATATSARATSVAPPSRVSRGPE